MRAKTRRELGELRRARLEEVDVRPIGDEEEAAMREATESWEYLGWVKRQPCAIAGCERRPCDAHHSTHGRGLSQKTDDFHSIPLCALHHHDFHAATGHFKTWLKAQRRDWQDRQVELHLVRFAREKAK